MGAFCTRTICNIEKGDENYAKLLDRRNMDAAKNTNDVPENDEMPLSAEASPSPDAAGSNTPKYTHATPNSSIMSVGDDTDSLCPSSPPKTISKVSSKHVSVPTPSIQEIQTAMDNMHVMFTPTQKAANNFTVNTNVVDSDSDSNKEQTPTLPTMAFDVSNLQLANPFASPIPSINPNNTAVPEDAAINGYDEDGKAVDDDDKGFPSTLPPIPTIPSEMSADFTPGNVAGNGSINGQDIQDIAPPAAADAVDKQPTLQDIFGGDQNNGGQNNGTFVIHGDESQDAATKLALQCEGSGQNDETDYTLPASAGPSAAEQNDAAQDEPAQNEPVKVEEVQKEESVKVGVVEKEEDAAGDVNENDANQKDDGDDKEKDKEVQFKINVEQVGNEANEEDNAGNGDGKDREEENGDDNGDNNDGDDDEVKEKQKLSAMENLGGNPSDDPWKSDYETSEFESADSFNDRGEDKQKTDRGTKRRGSKEESNKNQQLLTLSYDETTLNDESTSEEDEDESVDETPRGGAKKQLSLYREQSRWKWQKKDMSKHEKILKAEIEKLKMEQEMAEMNNAMKFYRQQSQQ